MMYLMNLSSEINRESSVDKVMDYGRVRYLSLP